MTINQSFNIKNSHQTDALKVLCVCSAGMLRSPTLANVLHKEYGYNTRSCGTTDYALIPITDALIAWADEIVIVDNKVPIPNEMGDWLHKHHLKKPIYLNIPDMFDWGANELQQECLIQSQKFFIDIEGELK